MRIAKVRRVYLMVWLESKTCARSAVLLLFLVLLLSACGPARPLPLPARTPSPASTSLNIGVSDGANRLPKLVSDTYQQQNEHVQLNFVAGNNRTLFDDLAAGELDAILVYHIPPGREEWFNPVALDGLAVVVHPDNPVRSLELSEVQALYSGQIGDWSPVGGNSTPVNPIGRERGADARTLFNQRIMAEQRMSINTLIEADNQALLQAVAADPNAIGYTMMSAMNEEVVALTIDGVAPEPGSTATQTYPLTVPLYFVSPAEPVDELRAFLAWLQSPPGQAILGEKFGRVS